MFLHYKRGFKLETAQRNKDREWLKDEAIRITYSVIRLTEVLFYPFVTIETVSFARVTAMRSGNTISGTE